MGIFNKFRKKEKDESGELKPAEVFNATPHFYSKPSGEIFGSFALTEDVITALPINPRETYKVEGKGVTEWQLCLVSITKDEIIGTLEYYEALNRLKNYSIGEKNGFLITNPLTLQEQQELLK